MAFWSCSLFAVASMSVTIGCLWCCICAMAWLADCESVNMTMSFTHGGFGLSQSVKMHWFVRLSESVSLCLVSSAPQ